MQPAFVDLVQRFLKRAATADFQREHAADDERAALAASTPPVTEPQAQDYMAWRRAVLWIGGVLLAIAGIIAAVEHMPVAEQFARAQLTAQARAAGQNFDNADVVQAVGNVVQFVGKDNLAILDGLMDFLLFVKIAAATLVAIAAVQWRRVRRSRSLVRWAWIVTLVLPLLVSAWPWARSMHFENEGGAQLKSVLALSLAVALFTSLGPKLIALFPGIIRSSMILKTLLPESPAPGWLTVVFAPFFAGFLLLVLTFTSQAQGSWLLLGGVLALCCGPVLFLRRAGVLIKPYPANEVGSAIGGVRRVAAIGNLVGVVLVVSWVCTLDIAWTTVVHMLLEAAGGILLTMVAISDITLALLAFAQQQNAQFQASELRTAFDQRLAALAGSGLTNVESALGMTEFSKLQELRRRGQI